MTRVSEWDLPWASPAWCLLQVDCLERALQAADLKVSILLDFTRGSRGGSLPLKSWREGGGA